jgi:uncharacterized membrane protein
MYHLQLEGKDRSIFLFIPGTVSEGEWQKKLTTSKNRYQEFKKSVTTIIPLKGKK